MPPARHRDQPSQQPSRALAVEDDHAAVAAGRLDRATFTVKSQTPRSMTAIVAAIRRRRAGSPGHARPTNRVCPAIDVSGVDLRRVAALDGDEGRAIGDVLATTE